MDSLVSQIIIDILINEMSLTDQDVWLDDLNYKVPSDDGLKITVGLSDAQMIGSRTEIRQDEDDIYEVNSVTVRENITIDIFSPNVTVMQRRWEIPLALNSIYSQQMQTKNNFRIFPLTASFLNTSAAEGGSQLARYTLTIPCHVWYKKEKLLSSTNGDYYDTFDARVDDEATIGTTSGIIEFTIDQDTEL